eukprot:717807-Hanusia_phi.AAC.1
MSRSGSSEGKPTIMRGEEGNGGRGGGGGGGGGGVRAPACLLRRSFPEKQVRRSHLDVEWRRSHLDVEKVLHLRIE